MELRERVAEALKVAMRAGDTARVSTVRMIMAKLKDVDIAARPKGLDRAPDDEVVAALRSMVKSRGESIELYRQGNRPDLVAKEMAEIAVIEDFLPAQLSDDEMSVAVDAALTETGAVALKDMGKVMAALRSRHAASLDMARVGPLVKARLVG
jgi:uncharacterized protein YqeY